MLFIIKHSARTEENKAHRERLTSVAQLDARPTGDKEVAGSTPPGRQHSFVGIAHEIFSTVILSLLLIQEGQLSVSR